MNYDMFEMIFFDHESLWHSFVVTQATRKQSLQYGCLAENEETHEVKVQLYY